MTAYRKSSEAGVAITRLAELSRDELLELWQAELGKRPPDGMSTAMVLKILAWDLQAKAQGGHKPSVTRALQAALAGDQSGTRSQGARPGAQLIREWNGKTHKVEVLETGFRWNGKPYRSLSAIAFEITGTKWSGPRFFGLRGRAQ